MMTIVDEIRTLLDNKSTIVTDELIKGYINAYIDVLVKEIKEEI